MTSHDQKNLAQLVKAFCLVLVICLVPAFPK